ncbi:MAG TPA: hypothetical protein VK483_11815 [Chitinophagaceae bacterium]|nr:hypothetical protein [Chitinophagaceae bacterium]
MRLQAVIISLLVFSTTAMAQTAGSNNTLNNSGVTAIQSSTASGYKLSTGGAVKVFGTGSAGVVGSPTIMLVNTTASNGKKFGIHSSDASLFQIYDSTTATPTVRFSISGATSTLGNVGIGTGTTHAAVKLEIDNTTAGTSGLRFTRLTSSSTSSALNGKQLSVNAQGDVIITDDITSISQTQKYVLAAPNGANGVPSFRALLASDIPTLNQNTTGTADNITGVLNATSHPALTGDVTTASGSVATTIATNAVTFSKFQSITDNRLLGRSAGSNGNMQEITVGSGLSLSGGALSATGSSQWTTTGNDIYYNTGNVGVGTTAPKSLLQVDFSSTGTGTVTTNGTTTLTGTNTQFTTNLKVGSSITVSGETRTVNSIISDNSLTVWTAFSSSVSNVPFTLNNYGRKFAVGERQVFIGQLVAGQGGDGGQGTSTVFGLGALANTNNLAYQNDAFGFVAGSSITSGHDNTALGSFSLQYNTTGSNNVAIGRDAMENSVTGWYNTAIGVASLYDMGATSGSSNTAIGRSSGRGITTGSGNTIIGAWVTGLSGSLTNTVIISDGSNTGASGYRFYSPASGNVLIGTTTDAGYKFEVNGTTRLNNSLAVDATGNVGIGTNTPAAKLDVAGSFKLVDGSQGAGKVLTSDANGLASWQPASGSNSQWTTINNDIYNNNSGNVGVGTSSPGYKLDVNGTLKVDGTAASQVQFTGPNQNNPGFTFNGSTSNTHAYTFDSQNFSTTTAGNTQVSGGSVVFYNNASVQPFQQPLTILRSWPGVGAANTVIIDNDNMNAVPSTYRIASFRLTGTEKAWIDQTGGAWFNGSVGIGTNSPQANLDVNGTVKLNNSLFVNSDGTVGIGSISTYPAGYQFAVVGNIIAEKVRVKLHSGWPDYVFGEKYPLPTLKETEQFIKQYNHLPGVPSATQIEKEGLDLGDGQALLLKKIEELTIHLIELDKKVDKLSAENEALKRKEKR